MSIRRKNTIQLSDHFTLGRLLRYCSPAMIMMVFTSVYGVVDGLFISNFVGKNAFAAVNLIMPVIMICVSFGTLFGTGGTALIAKTLGEGKQEEAKKIFSMILEVVVLFSAGITVIMFLLIPSVVKLLGANAALQADAELYGRILIVFSLPMLLQYIFQSFMNLAEKPKLGLGFIIAAGVTNMGLDALFVAVFRWGVAGAAVATGISAIVGGILPLLYFLSGRNEILQFHFTGIRKKPIAQACFNGVSELMTNISASIVSIVYNMQLMHYAGADGVAAYGVIMYVQYIFLGAMFGYTIGASPVISYHFGACHYKELNNLLRKSLGIEYIGGILMFTSAQLLARPISILFVGYDAQLLEMTVHAFRIFLFSFLLSGGNIFVSAFFTALNNGTISAVISAGRTLGFEMLSVLFLPLLLGLNGIWSAVFVAEIASCIMSWTFLRVKDKKYHYFRKSALQASGDAACQEQ